MQLQDMPGHLIRRINQHSAHVFQLKVKEAGFDLTPVQFSAMCAIRDTPGIDQASVSAQIAYDRATIGGVIDRLEKKGWISRKVSATDKRAREVSLTPLGEKVLTTVLPVVRALQSEILTGLTPEESATVVALLKKTVTSVTNG